MDRNTSRLHRTVAVIGVLANVTVVDVIAVIAVIAVIVVRAVVTVMAIKVWILLSRFHQADFIMR